MEDDERTEIIDDYDVEEETTNGVSIWKPLLAIFGVVAAGIGGFIFDNKRKQKYIDVRKNDTEDDEQED